MLLGTSAGDTAVASIVNSGERLIAPHLLDVEVTSTFRNLAAAGKWEPHRAERYLAQLIALPAERQPHGPLLARVWELRHNFSAYEAVYIALAEATESVLYTCDAKLQRGHRARVKVFAF
jgi:predicted nucleic acid-binding protein